MISKKYLQRLFYFSYILYFIPRYLEYTTAMNNPGITSMIDISKYASYALTLIICILGNKWHKVNLKKSLFILILITVIVYQIIFNDDRSLFFVFLCSYAYSLSFENEQIYGKYYKLAMYLHIIMFMVVILLFVLGVIDNSARTVFRYSVLVERNSLGFNYPGQLQMSILTIIMLVLYNKKKIQITDKIALVIFSTIIYFFSRTLMSFVLSIVIVFLIDKKPMQGRLADSIRVHLASICFVITILFVVLRSINNPIGLLVDRIVNYRFSLVLTALSKPQYGIKFLGTGFHNINEGVGGQYLYLDSEYMYMFVASGILYTVVAIYLFRIMMEYSVYNENVKLQKMLALLYINAIVNNGIINLVMNPFAIIMVPAIVQHFKTSRIIHRVRQRNR